jgi:hypothetical protein
MDKTIENALFTLERLFETLPREEMEEIINEIDNLENKKLSPTWLFFITTLFLLR